MGRKILSKSKILLQGGNAEKRDPGRRDYAEHAVPTAAEDCIHPGAGGVTVSALGDPPEQLPERAVQFTA